MKTTKEKGIESKMNLDYPLNRLILLCISPITIAIVIDRRRGFFRHIRPSKPVTENHECINHFPSDTAFDGRRIGWKLQSSGL